MIIEGEIELIIKYDHNKFKSQQDLIKALEKIKGVENVREPSPYEDR